MGTTCCYLNPFSSLTATDWIALFGVIVNAGLAYWIVRTIQNKLTNKRVLKDHFISEIKEIRSEYKTCLHNLYTNNTHPHRVIPWFKLMNIKVDDLIAIIYTKYKIDKEKLKPYQRELQELITNNTEFNSQFNNEKISFSEPSKSQFIKFQSDKTALQNIFTDKLNLLKEEMTEKYFIAKQATLDDYPIFMAIAEDIGYDATNRATTNNELTEIGVELAKFITHINETEK